MKLKSGAIALVFLVSLLTRTAHPGEDTTTPTVEKTVDRYKIVWERNIFDPNRVKAGPEGAAAAPAVTETPVTTPEERVAVMGVLLVNGRHVAFFEGSDTYQRHGIEGETLGSFTIKEVRLDGVRLGLDGETYDLPIGSGLALDATSGWKKDEAVASRAKADPAPPGPGAETAGGGLSVLEQLKAKRQQELEK